MIAIRPGRPAFDVLALVVDHPGQLDAEAIGHRLWRPRVTSTAVYLEVRRAIRELGGAWTTRASELLNRLRQAGCIEPMRPPQVAARWADLAAVDASACIEEAAGADDDPDPNGLRARLLADLVRRAPSSVAEWVGAAPDGNTQRAMGDLVELGIVVPPTFRWPTPKGTEIVRSARAPSAGETCGESHAALPRPGAAA